jgi:glycosyltransferase involved in cell wall biosynthesis
VNTLQPDAAASGARTIMFAHYGREWIRGSERCLLDLVKSIDRAKFRPVVLCNHAILANAVEELGATAIVHNAVHPSSTIAPRQQVRALMEVARAHNVQLIHVNVSLLSPALIPVARRLRVPILAHLHIITTEEERRHELLHQLSMVVGVSATSVQGFKDEGMPEARIRVIYNGVDGARLSVGNATNLRAQLGIPKASTVLGGVGSLIRPKGVDVLLDALHILRERGKDVHLILAGDGEERVRLQAQAEALSLTPFTHFLGERKDAGAVLRDVVDIAVSASRGEAFPLHVLESGYFGRPIVVSDIPSHREGVIDGVTGIVVRENVAASFADSISKLVDDTAAITRMGTAAQVRIANAFTIQQNVEQFESVYRELMDRPSREFGWARATSWPRTYTQWLRQAIQKRLIRR